MICLFIKSCPDNLQVGLSVAKPVNVSENQDQPSPISVLEPPFEEDDNTFPESSGNFKLHCPGIFSSISI